MEQEPKEIDINQKNDVINESKTFNNTNETPAQSGYLKILSDALLVCLKKLLGVLLACLKKLVILIVGILCVWVVGTGVCVGGYYLMLNNPSSPIVQSSLAIYIWMGASCIAPIIVLHLILKIFK